MPSKNIIFLLITFCSVIFTIPSFAQENVSTNNWDEWILDRHPDLNCPWQISSNNKKVCNWPGLFRGEIVEGGMQFELSVQLFSKEDMLILPGSKQNWPTNVTINQQKAVVIESNGKPQVHLHRGTNIIRGDFLWASVPAQLQLPQSIGLVQISQDNKLLPVSTINNRLIFSVNKKTPQLEHKNSLKVQVFRAIEDNVPIRLTTIIKLFVSGKAREVNIGQVISADSESIYLRSLLPARLEENGILRVQVKPGIYEITLGSRFKTSIETFSTHKVSPDWPEDEYISFIANSNIREVKLSGVDSIDTSLFDIPNQWKSYPTYRLKPTQQLTLTTLSSSEAVAQQNTININREIWLSFDGKDAISKDNISGQMNHDWRLNADETVQLGRATVNGNPVLITSDEGKQGVEIRSANINLQAVSSIEQVSQLNAVGWQTDVTQLTANIHLPPGWRAFYASGVDGIEGTWIQKWSLWDIFLLMVLIAVANKLLGIKGAIVMAVTLVFTFHETLAPNFLWAILLGLIALIRLPIGKYKAWLSWISLLPVTMLIIVFISLAISSLRLAVYPTLEKQGINPNYQQSALFSQPDLVNESMVQEVSEMEDTDKLKRQRISKSSVSQSLPNYKKQDLYQVGENDRVQTGPGIPTWSWNYLTIRSSGMVTMDQQINLWLSSPLLTAIWRIINVLLIALMGSVILRVLFNTGVFKLDDDKRGKSQPNADKKKLAVTIKTVIFTSGLSLLATSLLFIPKTVDAAIQLPDKAGYPPEYLLNEYENKLISAPLCLPTCVSLDNGLLTVTDKQLRLRFSAFADVDLALPLPSAGSTWIPEQINVDGKPGILNRINNQLIVYLSKGEHLITLQGRVQSAQMNLNLPFNIHHFSVNAPSWLIDGVRDGVVVNNSIGLTSKEKLDQEAGNTLTPLAIKPYAIVYRTINLGKQWTMTTRVEKIAPTNESGSFKIKLLNGEQILSAYPVNDGPLVHVQIAKNQRYVSWESSLPIENTINLQATDSVTYSENWRVVPSSLWNVTFSGIKPIKSARGVDTLQPNWMPWSNDKLSINVSRPSGVEGEIFTTEMAVLEQQTGQNIQQSKLMLNVLASQGTDYEIKLAEGVEVSALRHDGKPLNISGSNNQIVQLHPGEQRIEVEFKHRIPFSWQNKSADIILPGKVVNINLEYKLLNDRWLIYLNGPSLGASMLYWGMLLVIILGAIVLPIIAKKLKLNMPINTVGWVLLGVGFSTVNSYGIVITALFFFAMALRKQYIQSASMVPWKFNAIQIGLLILTFICIVSLLISIPIGLLSSPDMQVVGNGSYGHFFRFFQDKITEQQLPNVTVYSLPIWSYRIVMLAWSLWIATKLITWSKWWFTSYSSNGLWIKKDIKILQQNKD
jgi:hypothetical protein